MNKIRAKFKEAGVRDGGWKDNAVVKLYFKGDKNTAALLEEAILKILGKSVTND